MNGHAPGSEQLEQLRLRRRRANPTTRTTTTTTRSSSFSSNTASTTSSSDSITVTAQVTPTRTASASSQSRKTLSRLFLLFLLFRFFNAIVIKTFFQPDEYWQSLELAHKFVFNYGYRTWEWRPSSTINLKEILSTTTTSPNSSLTDYLYSNLTKLASGPVRSFAYPALYVPLFWILKVLRLDDTFLLTLTPRLLQASFAAVGDLYTFRLSQRALNEKAAYLTIAVSYFSLYGIYTSTRTFSNSLESVLTSIGLYYWPLSLPERNIPGADPLRSTDPTDRLSFRYALCAAAAACIIRPTNAIIWSFLLLKLIRDLSIRVDSVSAALEVCFQIVLLAKECLWILVGSLTLTISLDSIFYSTLTVTPISFLYQNVFKSISLFYGSNPFHWYFSQGLPVLTFTFLPFLLHGYILIFKSKSSSALGVSKQSARWFGKIGERDLEALKNLSQVSVFTILVFSFIGHKEFRFLQPLLPIFNLFITYSLMSLNRPRNSQHPSNNRNQELISEIEIEDSLINEQLGSESGSESESRILIHGRIPLIHFKIKSNFSKALNFIFNPDSKFKNWTKFSFLIQLPFMIYLSCFHCKAQIEILFEIQQLYDFKELKSIGFLMPCHSTPWQSHLHRKGLEIHQENEILGKARDGDENGSGDHGLFWFITCEPPIKGQNSATYKDQSDFFYQDPIYYLNSKFPKSVDPKFPPSPPIQIQAQSSSKKIKAKSSTLSEFDLGWSHTWPSHLVLFENLLEVETSRNEVKKKEETKKEETKKEETKKNQKEMEKEKENEEGRKETVGNLLEEKGYRIKKKLWNSFKHEDSRRDGDIVILEWISKR